jgi:hypothetical protein
LESILEEFKRRLFSRNARYHAVKNLSSLLLSINTNIKLYKTVILPVVLHGLYGCDTWFLTFMEEHRLKVVLKHFQLPFLPE